MNRIWQAHGPPGLDEARIRLPGEPLTACLKGHAARTPRKPACVSYGRPISFAELDDAGDRFAGWLRDRGIGPGDREALYLAEGKIVKRALREQARDAAGCAFSGDVPSGPGRSRAPCAAARRPCSRAGPRSPRSR